MIYSLRIFRHLVHGYSVNAKHLLRRADYVRSIFTSDSILRAEVKHWHLGCLSLVLWVVFDKFKEEIFKSLSLLFQSKVEILRVQVVQTVDHRAELGGDFLAQRLLHHVIDHPDVLLLLFGLQREALILERNVLQL